MEAMFCADEKAATRCFWHWTERLRKVFPMRVAQGGYGSWLVRTARVLLFAGALGLATSAPAQDTPLQTRVNPKAQELIDRTIQALGGPAFLNFKRLTTRGRIFAIEEGAMTGFSPFESSVEYPDKRRFSYGKSKPVILINNGDRSWEVDKMGVTNQLPEQVRRWKLSTRYSLENLLRLTIHEPGLLIQDGGVDFVDLTAVRIVEITDAQQVELKLYVNKGSFLPARISYRVQDPKTRDWQEYADVYGDYQKFQGITTPLHLTRLLDGERVGETFRNSVRYDEDYPANIFQPPS